MWACNGLIFIADLQIGGNVKRKNTLWQWHVITPKNVDMSESDQLLLLILPELLAAAVKPIYSFIYSWFFSV